MLPSGRHTAPASGALPPASLPPPPPPLPSLVESWQQVHHLLAGLSEQAPALPQALPLATYHYCVYKAFGQAPAAALAQRLLQQATPLLAQWRPAPGSPAPQLEQACLAAWLGTHLAADGLVPAGLPPLLAALDPLVQQQGLAQPEQAAQPQNLGQALRYFSLRQPTSDSKAFLGPLLASRPAFLGIPSPNRFEALLAPLMPWPLGLAEGLAAELRTLIRLHQAGASSLDLPEQVRHGIRSLLATRRKIDFLDQKFSVFPTQVQPQSGECSFGAALSWPHGDLGPVLLLYEAHHLLQDAELAHIADLVGLNTLLRTTPAATEVASAQLDRGAAGTAHLYRKLYLASQQPAYRQGQQFWLGQTQRWLRQELADGFYLRREGQLRHGLVGVGLVLLSAVADQVPDWDAALL